tara:strand:- start:5422 stop:6246 length:825 start_codon:yes stop_codon:yes gene_type:complete
MPKLISIIFLFFLSTCGSPEKKGVNSSLNPKDQAIIVYKEGLEALERSEYFYASKKFGEAEILLPQSEWAAKSALMVGYCFYSINFYTDAISNLERFTRNYPASENLDYANYLIAISYYEQILNEEKDIDPLIKSKEKIEFFLKEFPDTDYAIDLKYKLELVINQLAAKEMSIARYYIKNAKWIAAINRLKVVVEDYDNTIFVEEALFRLVEVYYKIGLEGEAKAAAAMLGYNYNSSEWYKQSYKILNKNYSEPIIKKKDKDDGLIKRTIKKML